MFLTLLLLRPALVIPTHLFCDTPYVSRIKPLRIIYATVISTVTFIGKFSNTNTNVLHQLHGLTIGPFSVPLPWLMQLQ